MADRVEESDDIRFISPEALDRQAQLLKEAEDMARRAESVDKRLTNNRAPIGDLGLQGSTERTIPRGGNAPFGTPESYEDFIKRIAREAIEENNKLISKETQEKIDGIEQSISQIDDRLSEATDFLSDPQAFVFRLFNKIPFVTKIFGTAGIIAGVAKVVRDQIEKLHGRGELFDLSRVVKEELLLIPELKQIIEAKNGKIFMTADLTLRQRAPTYSSTIRLRDGDDLFRHENIGRITGGKVY